MQTRDREGREAATIAAVTDLDGKRVVEVGCGSGRLTGFAAARAARVYAFDPDAESVAKLPIRLPSSSASASGLPSTMRRRSISRAGGLTWRSVAGRCDASRLRAS